MSWIGHAEELRREGRLIRRVCEGARDAVHVRSRLEARAGAGCRRQRRRLEIWIVAPLGIGSEEPRHVSHGLRRPFCQDVLHGGRTAGHSRCQNLGSRPPRAAQLRRTAAAPASTVAVTTRTQPRTQLISTGEKKGPFPDERENLIVGGGDGEMSVLKLSTHQDKPRTQNTEHSRCPRLARLTTRRHGRRSS